MGPLAGAAGCRYGGCCDADVVAELLLLTSAGDLAWLYGTLIVLLPALTTTAPESSTCRS
jgi:hypothetical protein